MILLRLVEVDIAGREIARYTLQEYKELYAKLVRRGEAENGWCLLWKTLKNQTPPEVEVEVPAQANQVVKADAVGFTQLGVR
jgi:hypothetical protein